MLQATRRWREKKREDKEDLIEEVRAQNERLKQLEDKVKDIKKAIDKHEKRDNKSSKSVSGSKSTRKHK